MNGRTPTLLALALLLAGCGHAVSDDALLAAVKAKLVVVDPNSTTAVGVRVADGVATLQGEVRTEALRGRLEAAARSVPGIHDVRDDLRVNPAEPTIGQRAGDAALAARIEAAIVSETGSTAVRVAVDRGTVTLSGSVADPKVRDAALSAARNTSGVRGVVDHMHG